MSDRDFGGLVREARDRLGMSHNRVADLIGRSPSTVKAWERGRSVPADANVVSSLAAVLGVDEGALFDAAGLERPGTPLRPTLGQSLSEIAPPSTVVGNTPSVAVPATQTAKPAAQTTKVDVKEAEPEPAQAPESVPLKPRRELRDGGVALPAPEPGGAWASVLNAVDRVSSRLRRRPRRHALVARPLQSPVQPSYVEDPEQRLIYRMRSLMLAAGVAVLALVFVWSMGEFLDAFGASLDAILGPE